MRKALIYLGMVLMVAALSGCDDSSGGGQEPGGPTCGDGVREGTEQCDGTDFGGATCASMGAGTGSLSCTQDCRIDTSSCHVPTCGDGVREGTEQCDGTDLGGTTCESLGYYGGSVTCTPSCKLDISQCEAAGRCGDGILQPDHEECDGDDFAGLTCEALGYYGGSPRCDSNCRLDLRECKAAGWCGDGIIQPEHEVCDGTGFGVFTVWCDECHALMAIDQYGSPNYERNTYMGEGAIVRVNSEGRFIAAGNTRGPLAQNRAEPYGASDVYVKVYSPDGEQLWDFQFGGGHEYTNMGAAIDEEGNVYLGLNEMDGSLFGLPIGGTRDVDIVVASLDRDGNIRWGTRLGTTRWDDYDSNLIVEGGKVYFGGHTYGDLVSELVGYYDAYVMVLDGDTGEVLSSYQFGTEEGDHVSAVGLTARGRLITMEQMNYHDSSSPGYIEVAKRNGAGRDDYWSVHVHDGTSLFYPMHSLYVNDARLYEEQRIYGAIVSRLEEDATPQTYSEIFALDGNGNILWTHEVRDATDGMRVRDYVLHNGRLYVVGLIGRVYRNDKYDRDDDEIYTDGFLLVLDAETGEELEYWEYPGNRQGTVFQSVAVLPSGAIIIGGGTTLELEPGNAAGLWDHFVLILDKMEWHQ